MHASLALSSLLSVWCKPNSLNNKSICNTLLLEFYISAKPRLTHWYQCPKIKCHYFCTGVYMKRNVYTVSAPFLWGFSPILPIYSRPTSLVCVCPTASEAPLRNMNKITRFVKMMTKPQLNKSQHNRVHALGNILQQRQTQCPHHLFFQIHEICAYNSATETAWVYIKEKDE